MIPHLSPDPGPPQGGCSGQAKDRGVQRAAPLERRTPLRIILEVLREPMLALLLGGGAIYLALGT